MSNYDLLIKNGTILTIDQENTIIDDGTIAIKNQKIIKIDSSKKMQHASATINIDARNCIIMPGLINTHTHLPMSLFRGLADDLELMTWLNDYIFKAEAKYINPENTRTGTLISCAEILLSGTTTICDAYFHEDIVADAVNESGLKGILGQGVIDFPAPGVPDPSLKIQNAIDYVYMVKDRYSKILPSIFCHSPYTCSTETLVEAKKAANNANVLFQIHISETESENLQIKNEYGKTPVEYLYDAGILDKNTLLIHSVWVNENDIGLIKKSGSAISHCPESNMKLASGTAPLEAFLKAGIRTGLGTDGSASNNNLDLFSEMDSAAKLHKVHNLDPSVADASTILKMATIDGARSLGLDSETGSLEVGKKADIIIIDTNKPHLVPMYNPVSHIVYSATGADVRDVIINGEQIVKNRNILTIDLDIILEKARLFASEMEL